MGDGEFPGPNWLQRIWAKLGGGLPAALSASGRLKVELGALPTIDIGKVDQGDPNAGGALAWPVTGPLTQAHLETELDEKLGDLGQKARAGSAPVTLSPEDILALTPSAPYTGGLTQTELATELDEKFGDLGVKASAGSAPVVTASDDANLASLKVVGAGAEATAQRVTLSAEAVAALELIGVKGADGATIASTLNPVSVEQDSGENEYTPGLGSGLIPTSTAAGYTKIYDQAVAGNTGFKTSTPNTPGRAFYIRSVKAASVERDAENPPVLSLEIRNSDDATVFHVPYTLAMIWSRKKIICPVNGKVYLKTDIATRLPWTIDIQEIP